MELQFPIQRILPFTNHIATVASSSTIHHATIAVHDDLDYILFKNNKKSSNSLKFQRNN